MSAGGPARVDVRVRLPRGRPHPRGRGSRRARGAATRERVLVAGVDGDEHPLELQMMHDQLAAAGYRTILDQTLAAKDLARAVDSHSPDVVLLGAAVPASARELESAVRDLAERHADIPIVLGGIAAGGEVPRKQQGMRVLERIDESVEAVEELLAARTPAASR